MIGHYNVGCYPSAHADALLRTPGWRQLNRFISCCAGPHPLAPAVAVFCLGSKAVVLHPLLDYIKSFPTHHPCFGIVLCVSTHFLEYCLYIILYAFILFCCFLLLACKYVLCFRVFYYV